MSLHRAPVDAVAGARCAFGHADAHADRCGSIKVDMDSQRGEKGYTLLFVIFLVAITLIATSVVVPDLLTQGKREQIGRASCRERV